LVLVEPAKILVAKVWALVEPAQILAKVNLEGPANFLVLVEPAKNLVAKVWALVEPAQILARDCFLANSDKTLVLVEPARVLVSVRLSWILGPELLKILICSHLVIQPTSCYIIASGNPLMIEAILWINMAVRFIFQIHQSRIFICSIQRMTARDLMRLAISWGKSLGIPAR
jgi:hypothetical protein